MRPVHGAGDGPIAQPPSSKQDGPSSERHPSPGASRPTQVLQYPPLAGRQSDRCFGFGPSPSRFPMPFLFSHATQNMSPRVGPEFMGQCTSTLRRRPPRRGARSRDIGCQTRTWNAPRSRCHRTPQEPMPQPIACSSAPAPGTRPSGGPSSRRPTRRIHAETKPGPASAPRRLQPRLTGASKARAAT